MRSSAIRELLKLTEEPDIISFAGGLPSPDVFPANDFRSACMHVLEEHGPEALQYGTTEGFTPLRQMIARHAKRYGITAGPENILMTCGSQQALDLIGKVFIDPGDPIIVEKPTYLGALQAWNAYEANFLGVPIDDEGIRLDELEQALNAGGKFVYIMPNFQNPTGVTLSLERRKRLIELVAKHEVPLIEDDPYGQLRYEGKHIAPLFALDGPDVIYLSTFSKILSPGLRLGWIVAPPDIIHRLVQAKQGTDLHTSTLIQMVVYEVSHGGFLDRQVRTIRSVYRERRDSMLSAMKKYFPAGVTWTQPYGGLFLWVTLPASLDSADVLREALKEKVAFVPGASFYPDGSGANTMRLNFSYSKPAIIEEGIRRLGKVLKLMQPNAKPIELSIGSANRTRR
jgi:2-aminoadipate transaminase